MRIHIPIEHVESIESASETGGLVIVLTGCETGEEELLHQSIYVDFHITVHVTPTSIVLES